MKTRKGLAEDIKRIIFSEEIATNQNKIRKTEAYLIFNIMKEYYEIYDLDNNTNHSKIFEHLYLSKKYLSDLAIAQRTFISIDTLRKYEAKYNRLTGLLIKRLNFKL